MKRHVSRLHVIGTPVAMILSVAACRSSSPPTATHMTKVVRAATVLTTCSPDTVVATLAWNDGPVAAPNSANPSGTVQDWVLTQPIDTSELAQVTGCQNATVGNLSVWEGNAEVPSEFEDDQTLTWQAPGTTSLGQQRTFELRLGPPGATLSFPAPVDVSTTPDGGLVAVSTGEFTITHDVGDPTLTGGVPPGGLIVQIARGGTVAPISTDNRFSRTGYASSFVVSAHTVSQKKLRTIVEMTGAFLPFQGGQDPAIPAVFRYTYFRDVPLLQEEVELSRASAAPPFSSFQLGTNSLSGASAGLFSMWLTEGAPQAQAIAFPSAAGQSFLEVDTEVGSSARWGLIFDPSSDLAFGIGSPTFNDLELRNGGVITFGAGPSGGEYEGESIVGHSSIYFGPAGGPQAPTATAVLASALDQQITVSISGLSDRLAAMKTSVAESPPSAARSAAATLVASAGQRQEMGRELLFADELIQAGATVLSGCGGDVCVADSGNFWVAANSDVGLAFKHTDGLLSLDNVVHSGQSYGFLEPALSHRPLWQLQMKEGDSVLAINSSTEAGLFAWDNDATLTLTWPASPAANRPAVTATVSLRPSASATGPRLTNWAVAVAPPSLPASALWQVDFPVLGGLRRNPSLGPTKMVLPLKSGALLNNPQSYSTLLYPGEAVAQLLPLWQETTPATGSPLPSPAGLYLAAHDGEMNSKVFRLAADGTLTTQLSVRHPILDMGDTYVGFTMDPEYRFSIGAFDGDWFDAARIYRAWVDGTTTGTPAPWLPAHKLASNTDIPDWFKQSSFTVLADYLSAPQADGSGQVKLDPAQVTDFVDSLQSRGPVLLQLYGWHQTPDCNHAPLVLPHSSFSADAATWIGHQIYPVVWELFNGFNPNAYASAPYNDSYAGSPSGYVPVNASLEPAEAYSDTQGTLFYSPAECADQPEVGADPRNPTWQAVQTNIVETIAQTVNTGSDFSPIGVYLDVAATPGALPLCMRSDANHGHLDVGGGHELVDVSRALMSSMRIQGRTVLSSGQPMVATVAEGAGEAFMNVTDSHFSFRGDGVWPSYVPMFESIYADYIRPFGSKGIDAVSSRTAAASAQQFAYGGHIGRVAYGDATAPVPANYPSTLYAKDLGKYREALLPFLGFGEMARPPALTYGSSVAASNPSALATNGTLVVSSAWRTVDPLDPRMAFVLANADIDVAGNRQTPVSFSVDPQAYGIPADYNLVRLTVDDAGGTTQSSVLGDLQQTRLVSVVLKPLQVVAFVAEPVSFNLALNGLASQSNTLSYGAASLAVDGATDGNYSIIGAAAGGPANPWWQVDLGEDFFVEKVRIWNATDNFRNQQIYMFASGSPLPNDLDAAKQQMGMAGAPPQIPGALALGVTELAVNGPARFVRLQHAIADVFYIAEVQVIGHRLNGSVNLSQGSPDVSQTSSMYPWSHAEKAVDGNTSGDQSQETFIDLGAFEQSNSSGFFAKNSWWQIDLGSVQTLSSVQLWNISGGSNYRNNTLDVFVSDQPFAYEDFAATRDQPGVSMYGVPGDWSGLASVALPVGRTGRYVRVAQSTDWDTFYLAEVQVMGDGGQNLSQLSTSVSQSSVRYPFSGPDKAVDGNTNGDPNAESYIDLGSPAANNDQGPFPRNPWWQIDLGASHALTDVWLWNVSSGSNYRNNTLRVFVSDDPFAYDQPEATTAQVGVSAYDVSIDWSALPSLPLAVNRSGRYVRVQQVTPWDTFYLSEVQVMGQP